MDIHIIVICCLYKCIKLGENLNKLTSLCTHLSLFLSLSVCVSVGVGNENERESANMEEEEKEGRGDEKDEEESHQKELGAASEDHLRSQWPTSNEPQYTVPSYCRLHLLS